MKPVDWHKKAERLGGLIPAERLHHAVREWIKTADAGMPWCVACSGGADSVCLLLLLYAHFPEKRGELRVLHFNHRLRGEESDGDEVFVKGVAEGLELQVIMGQWDRSEIDPVSEALARSARYAFFSEAMKELKSRVLFLGHHRNDIAETMLMRLARGSGTEGLAAPRPVKVFENGTLLLRPLLDLDKDEILEALREAGVPWREDASNEGDDFLRNRLRNKVLPVFQEVAEHDVFQGAAQSRKLLEEDHEALETWLEELFPDMAKEETCDFAVLAGKPRALWRRAVQRFLSANGLGDSLSREASEELLDRILAGETCRVSAGSDTFIEFSSGILSISERAEEPGWLPLTMTTGSKVFFPYGEVLAADIIAIDTFQNREIQGGAVDESKEAFIHWEGEPVAILRVRRWEPGDRYRPLGAPGKGKLQDHFTNRKIPVEERKQLPIVCNLKGEILWCPGLPPADAAKIHKRTNYALRLTYTPR